MKRVLIITYYWPPCGGSAVLRWLKFSKYLRDYAWEPVIYTPENPEPQEIDNTLLADAPEDLEVVKTRIIEPYGLYKILTGKKPKEMLGVALLSDKKKPGLMGKVSLWIRSNFFIPDPRVLWIRPSAKFLEKYLKNNPVDIIVSTGPPHSMHLIAKKLKEKTGIMWIADFRDPWTNIDFYRELKLTAWADRRHRELESKVLRKADHVITVSSGMTNEFLEKGISHVTTITNGYDEEPKFPGNSVFEGFNIVHLGSMPKSRNPESLWNALESLLQNEPQIRSNIKVRLIGRTDIAVLDSIKKHHIGDIVVQHPYIPHSEAQGMISAATVLLLCINNTENAGSILTNKFFEYLSVKRPIIAIGPEDGDAATILHECGAGKIFHYTDAEGLKHHVAELYDLFSKKELKVNSKNIERFSRKNLTNELSELFNRLTE